jgi:hypothetical protein
MKNFGNVVEIFTNYNAKALQHMGFAVSRERFFRLFLKLK